MKDAIITVPGFWNLGNRLQNYAAYQVLISLNQNAVSIRGETWQNSLGTFNKKIRYICSLSAPGIMKHVKLNSVRYSNFERFSKQNDPECVYYSDSLRIPNSVGNQFDFFIAGSDQIWNPNFWGENETAETFFNNYLLTFAHTEKRISYAASFGVSTLPEKWKSRFANELTKFKAISVREESGAKIVKELTGRDAEVLIDPTMMLCADQWRKISRTSRIRTKKACPYILKYFLGDQSQEKRSCIQSIAKDNNLDIYELLDKNYPELYTVAPDEFIDLMDHASLIYTDSFHATVFAILFHKPFVVMQRTEAGMADMSSRLTTLLGKLHLERKLPDKIKKEDIFECDYNMAYQYLESERKKAYAFLKDALGI